MVTATIAYVIISFSAQCWAEIFAQIDATLRNHGK